jgi:hypothetical protein
MSSHVSPLFKDAEEIFGVACRGGAEECEWAILVAHDGAIQVVPAADWELEPLRIHHGAKAAYRVWRTAGRVRLEARSAAERYLFEERRPPGALRAVLPEIPQYLTVSAQ